MEHPEKIIELNFLRKDFEEIYFRNKQSNIFLSPLIKREFFSLVILLIALLSSIIYSLTTDKNAWLIILFALFSIVAFIPYFIKALHIQKWRSNVVDFLDNNEQFKSHKLILNNETLSLVQDNKENIHKWSAFTHIEITETYVLLTGTVQYFFPNKSMQAEDYKYFIETIRKQLKNGL